MKKVPPALRSAKFKFSPWISNFLGGGCGGAAERVRIAGQRRAESVSKPGLSFTHAVSWEAKQEMLESYPRCSLNLVRIRAFFGGGFSRLWDGSGKTSPCVIRQTQTAAAGGVGIHSTGPRPCVIAPWTSIAHGLLVQALLPPM